MNQTKYLTVPEVEARLRIAKGTLANWRNKGKGPVYVKFGHRVMYPERELLAWEQKNLHVGIFS